MPNWIKRNGHSDEQEEDMNSNSPRRPTRPRRMKSFSEAINLIGTSIHHVYKSSTISRSKSKSNQNLNNIDNISEPGTIRQIKKLKKQKSHPGFENLPVICLEEENRVICPVINIIEAPSGEEEEHQQDLMEKVDPTPKPNPRKSQKANNTEESPKISVIANSPSPKLKKSLENNIMKPPATSNSNSTNDCSNSLKPKQRDRSASMVWVDFLTTPGISIQDTNDDEEIGFNENHRKSDVDGLPRKIWFGKNTTDSQDDDDVGSDIGGGGSRKGSRKISESSLKAKTPEEAVPHRNVDDLIFDMFREKDEELVLVGKFLAALEKTGLRKTDPRLTELFENLQRTHKQQEESFPQKNIGSIETLRLDRDTFKQIITDNIVLISRAFRQQFIIPEFQIFCKLMEDIYVKCKDVKGGKVASYIPQLARVDPNYFALSICTIDGQRHSFGDTQVPFTLQSCSKPLTYAMALNELGPKTVHEYVGQEPSGRMFNELVLDYNKKPHNPMVNAGAIIVCSLLKSMVKPEMTLAEKFDYTFHYFKRLGGGEYMGFNNAVFLSEREAADRNYALGFYMREYKCFPEGTNLKENMDYYFQCCSMETTCETASVIAATLANGGICPISGEKVLKSESVRDVLSLMHSCGMYDYSGQFAFKVGLPAKSGVSGTILLVVPNVMGIAIYSPALDSLGNSVRGLSLCEELIQVFNFHKYDNLRHASNKIDPRRHKYETKGLNIVNLLFSAASGDVTSMRRHHLSGMDMNASDYDGRTALHLAAAEGHLECVEYLLRHCHVPYDPLDRWSHLPLDDAERFNYEEVAEFLRKWAADEEKRNQ